MPEKYAPPTDFQRFSAFWRFLEAGNELVMQGYGLTVHTDYDGHQDLVYVLRASTGKKHYATCDWPLSLLFEHLRELGPENWVMVEGVYTLRF